MSNETVRVIKFGEGGVNLNAAARAIRDDQLAYAKNTWPTQDGLLQKRPGIVATEVVDTAAELTCLSWIRADPVTGYRFVAHILKHNTMEHYLVASSFNASDGTFTTNATYVNMGALQGIAQLPVSFVNYRGRVIAVVPGLEGFYHLVPLASGTGFEWVKATFAFYPRDVAITTTLAFEQQQTSGTVTPYIAAMYRGRMRYLNLGPGREHWMITADAASNVHTDLRQYPLWAVCGSDLLAYNSRHQELDALSGKKITGALEVTLKSVSRPVESALLVLTEETGVIITGDISQTSDTDASDPRLYVQDFAVNRVNYDVGCSCQATIVRTPYGTFWVGPDDVWVLYLDAGAPIRIGTNIRPAIQACPATGRKFWSAAYSNGVLVISLVTDVKDSESGGAKYLTLDKQQWWLDLRRGAPQDASMARWFGPQEVSRTSTSGSTPVHLGPVLTDKTEDGSERIVSFGMDAISGLGGFSSTFLVDYTNKQTPYDIALFDNRSAPEWASATVVNLGQLVRATSSRHFGRLFIVTTAGTTGLTEPTWPTADSGTVNDNGVVWSELFSSLLYRMINHTADITVQTTVRGKDYDFGVAEREKILRGIELSVGASDNQYLQCLVRSNQKKQNNLGAPIIGGDDDSTVAAKLGQFMLGPDNGFLSGELQARMMRPDETSRVRGRYLQTEFSDDTSYIIDDSNDTIIVCMMNELNGQYYSRIGEGDSSASPPLSATLTHGAYANLNAVLDQVIMRLCGLQFNGLNWGTFQYGANWSYTDAFQATTSPYMTKIALEYLTLPDVTTTCPAFLFGNTDTATYKFLRCMRLLSMLGFNTNVNLQRSTGGDPTQPGLVYDDEFFELATALWAPAQQIDTGAKKFYFHGTSVVPYKHSVNISYDEAVLITSIVRGKPFQGQGR